MSEPESFARPVLDLSPTAANCLLGMLHGAAVHGLIPVEVWNRLVGEAEEFAERSNERNQNHGA